MKWIIGDVHGSFETLKALVEQIKEKGGEPIFTGDLVDRGPSSREVIEFVKENNYLVVRGNHEEMMIEALDSYFTDKSENAEYRLSYSDWFRNGGDKCFEQYQSDKKLLFEHNEWLKTLPYYLIFDDLVLEDRKLLITHSWASHLIDSYIEHKSFYLAGEIIWNRNKPKKSDKYFNIFGHTPVPYISDTENIIIDTEKGYANIDSGNVYHTKFENGGVLTAIAFPSLEIIQQKNLD